MFSLSKAVWLWLSTSANDLLDLANMGRDSNNVFVLAIAAVLSVIRIAALLIFTLPALAWLKNQIWVTKERKYKEGWAVETNFQAIVIILLIASIAFEIWVSPTRTSDADAKTPDAAITEQVKGGG